MKGIKDSMRARVKLTDDKTDGKKTYSKLDWQRNYGRNRHDKINRMTIQTELTGQNWQGRIDRTK